MSNNIIIFTAQYLILVLPFLVLYAWMIRNKKDWKRPWMYFILTVLLTAIFGFLGSRLYVHARPFVVTGVAPLFPHAADNSFPSDHTLLTAGIAAGLWGVSKKISGVAWLVAILVGVARVLAGVHWPIDILGSMIMAIAAGVVAVGVLKRANRSPQSFRSI